MTKSLQHCNDSLKREGTEGWYAFLLASLRLMLAPQGAPRRPKLDDAVGAGKLGRLRRIYADRRFKPQPLEVELDRLPIRLFTSRKD